MLRLLCASTDVHPTITRPIYLRFPVFVRCRLLGIQAAALQLRSFEGMGEVLAALRLFFALIGGRYQHYSLIFHTFFLSSSSLSLSSPQNGKNLVAGMKTYVDRSLEKGQVDQEMMFPTRSICSFLCKSLQTFQKHFIPRYVLLCVRALSQRQIGVLATLS